MKYIRHGAAVAAVTFSFAISGCNPANDSKSAAKTDSSPVAATVNGKGISQRTVDMIVEQGAASGRPDTPESRTAIIDQLALQILLADEAVKKGLDKTPEYIEQMELMTHSALANAYVQDFIKNSPVSDEAIKAEYERIKAAMTGSEYKARHILVESEAEAKDIIVKLNKDPGAFAKLATERSKDQGSATKGGDLGWFDLGRMVPEFSEALGKLEKGKFTVTPVQSQFGYHVILLEDVRPIEAPPLADVSPQLAEQLQQQNLEKRLEELKSGAKIEITGSSAAAAPAAAVPESQEASESATQ